MILDKQLSVIKTKYIYLTYVAKEICIEELHRKEICIKELDQVYGINAEERAKASLNW